MKHIQLLPDWMYHAIEESFTCQFTSVTKSGTPVALPVFLNHFDPNTGILIISSPAAVKRVENVRQHPEVAMLFFDAIHDESRYHALRPRMYKMDRQTQAREIRKLISGPDFMLGSINAITEDGVLVAASASSSQLGPYASTAGKVILVVGSQKIVPDLETALRRIHHYVLPWEDAQIRKLLNRGSFVGKILLVEREGVDGRMTVILVRQPIGI
jgi:hypothetical protein